MPGRGDAGKGMQGIAGRGISSEIAGIRLGGEVVNVTRLEEVAIDTILHQIGDAASSRAHRGYLMGRAAEGREGKGGERQ